MNQYRLATFMVIISLITLTIYYLLRVSQSPNIEIKHMFLSYVNVAFITMLIPTLAKQNTND